MTSIEQTLVKYLAKADIIFKLFFYDAGRIEIIQRR
jgi:hypothetical protein